MPRIVVDEPARARRIRQPQAAALGQAEPARNVSHACASVPEQLEAAGASGSTLEAEQAVQASSDVASAPSSTTTIVEARRQAREALLAGTERLPGRLLDPDVLEARRVAAEAVQAELAAARSQRRKARRRKRKPVRTAEQLELLRVMRAHAGRLARAQRRVEELHGERSELFRRGRELGLSAKVMGDVFNVADSYVVKVLTGVRR